MAHSEDDPRSHVRMTAKRRINNLKCFLLERAAEPGVLAAVRQRASGLTLGAFSVLEAFSRKEQLLPAPVVLLSRPLCVAVPGQVCVPA